MRKITVIHQKGGTGKTTTAVNLGAALSEMGREGLRHAMEEAAGTRKTSRSPGLPPAAEGEG